MKSNDKAQDAIDLFNRYCSAPSRKNLSPEQLDELRLVYEWKRYYDELFKLLSKKRWNKSAKVQEQLEIQITACKELLEPDRKINFDLFQNAKKATPEGVA